MSELAQVAGKMHTDKDGNLLNADGSIYTKNATGTLNENYANTQDLTDDAAAKNFTHAISVWPRGGEWRQVQQGQQPSTGYVELESGRLAWDHGPRTSEPAQAPQPVQQVANGQIIDAKIGKTIVNVGSAFTVMVSLQNGQRRLVRIAEYGHSISAVMTYHIDSGAAELTPQTPGTSADFILHADDSVPAGWLTDGWSVYSGDVYIYITRAMPDGVASGDVVIDVQEAR